MNEQGTRKTTVQLAGVYDKPVRTGTLSMLDDVSTLPGFHLGGFELEDSQLIYHNLVNKETLNRSFKLKLIC